MTRVLAIGLDGFEESYGAQLMREGAMPELAALRARGAHVLLDHGSAQRSGLAWEHLWSGLDPEAAGRDAAVEFDQAHSTAWQEGARFAPFFAEHAERAVVFDAPYADLDLAPGVRGVTAWGAHDPGMTGGRRANPDGLVDELDARFGPYPSAGSTYATPWASPSACEAMGRQLVAGIEARREVAGWLLSERLPDWDLALVVVAELHSAVEGLWHGVDPDHPLHPHPSALAAGAALRTAHTAVDRLVGDLTRRVRPDVVVVFAMGGMGPNRSDVQSMVLLPELLHRWSTGSAALVVPEEWTADPTCVPGLVDGRSEWDREWFWERSGTTATATRRIARIAAERLPRRAVQAIRDRRRRNAPQARTRSGFQALGWQPATWYRHLWSTMPAFAIPSYYDGRVRINLRGREVRGIVDPSEYDALCERLIAMLHECTDPRTGEPSVIAVERPGAADPFAVRSSGCDLAVVWSGTDNAIAHPDLGIVGPVPFHRTGGHTGRYGGLLLVGEGVRFGENGTASTFDVVPTLLDLMDIAAPTTMSGQSLLGLLTEGR